MLKSGVLKVIPVIISAIAVYIIAGFFMDIPPYKILLRETLVNIKISPEKADVEARMDFYCHSRFPAKNEYFLPFYLSKIQAAPESVEGIEEGSEISRCRANFRQVDGGVIYKIKLKPGESRRVTFRFSQKITGEYFICNFTRMTGWTTPAARVRYNMEIPLSYTVHTIPNHNFDEQKENMRVYILDNRDLVDPGMTMKFDMGGPN